jgi:hypothetical protein
MLGPELRTGRNLGAGSVYLTDRYDSDWDHYGRVRLV